MSQKYNLIEITESRDLTDDDLKIEEDKRVNRSLLYGLLLGTTLSMVPPALMPIDYLIRDGCVVIKQKDPIVPFYSLLLGYLGIVAPFIATASSEEDRRRSRLVQSRLCAEIQRYYREEDGLDE